tara:strand:- start:1523 stop:2062 length:540 start_codon:yes stop_codon:yes gene_type:complete
MKKFVLALTVTRIMLAPIILIISIFFENYWAAFLLFNIAALTDYFDGKLARDYGVETRLGAILDPIADKVLLVFIIITVISITQDFHVSAMSAFILGREFWVSALREYAQSSEQSSATEVTFIAKSKTTFQFIALSMFLLGEAAQLALVSFLANFVLFLALILSYKSAIDYSQRLLKLK